MKRLEGQMWAQWIGVGNKMVTRHFEKPLKNEKQESERI